jgi:serine/threonine protein kinase
MAPDLYINKNSRYSEKVDIWSLGTIYYELLVGMPPFFDRTHEGFSKKMTEGNYEFP